MPWERKGSNGDTWVVDSCALQKTPQWSTIDQWKCHSRLQSGEPFLGFVDEIGTCFSDQCIATGLAAHVAWPLMRCDVGNKSPLTKDAARVALSDCLQVLLYRDGQALNKVGLLNFVEKVFNFYFIVSNIFSIKLLPLPSKIL